MKRPAAMPRVLAPMPPKSRATAVLLAPVLPALLPALLPILLAACTTPPQAPALAPAAMAPFTTDGCSMFPDHSPSGKADWCVCCVAHDLAYWRGGSADERVAADAALERCVRTASGDATLARTMLAGVRVGGSPYFPTSYRWGYGWPYGRGYAPLSPDEEDQAARLRTRYLSEHPVLTCPAPVPVVTGP